MSRRGERRPSWLRKYSTASLVSIALHAALVLVLVVSLPFANRPETARPQMLAIQATVIDESRVQQEREALEQQERAEIERRQREEREALEAAEAARRTREREQQRLEETRRESERAAEQERARLADVQRQREAEAQRRADEERRRAEAEAERLAKQRAEEEQRQAAEEAQRQAAEAERRRQEAIAARHQAELEAQLQAELAAEAERTAAVQAGMLDQYIGLIQNHIQRQWIAPASARAGLECTLYVTQVPGGVVRDVRVGQCNGDAAVVRSIEAAVLRASPLPRPPVPALFDRNLEVTFRPDL